MYNVEDEWPQRVNDLIYQEKCVSKKDRNYINKTLKLEALRLFINLRYITDPLRYDNMNKNQLINELKYKKYD